MISDDDGRKRAERASGEGDARVGAEAVVHALERPTLLLADVTSVVVANDAFHRRFGTTRDAVVGHRLFEIEGGRWDAPGLRERLDRAASGGGAFEAFEIDRDFDGEGRRTMVVSGRRADPLGLVMLSVDADQEAGVHPHTLMREMQRRVRNTLASVRSLVARTAAHSDDLPAFLEVFDGRLGTLARVQALAMRARPGWIDLHELVLDELNTYGARTNDNLDLDGEDLTVDPRAGQTLAFAIHELVANAVTHGALASNGRITVDWRLVDGAEGPHFHFEWTETGVETGDAPARLGFGRRLIEESVPYELGGRARLEITPPTVTCRIEAPCEGWIARTQLPFDSGPMEGTGR